MTALALIPGSVSDLPGLIERAAMMLAGAKMVLSRFGAAPLIA